MKKIKICVEFKHCFLNDIKTTYLSPTKENWALGKMVEIHL